LISNIRPATDDDVPAIATAYITSWKAGYAGLLTDAEIEAQAKSRSRYVLGVVECEHKPKAGRLPWLQMLYVIPPAWGTGTAKALLNEALAAVTRAGHRTTWLEVVEAQTRARRFYEREGWKLDDSIAPTSNGLFRLLHYRHDASGRDQRGTWDAGTGE
jgi:GNAT superfamily N-acetyltransferase